MFWPNLSEQENDAVDHAEALEAVGGGWKTTLIKHSEEDIGCTNCLCMENWYRTGNGVRKGFEKGSGQGSQRKDEAGVCL